MDTLVDIIHEDDNLLVVNKPAGLVCHPTKSGPCSSLIGRVRLYFGTLIQPHLVNRLDRESSGLVLVAKNRHCARDLGLLFEGRRVNKSYLGIVKGNVSAQQAMIDAPIGKDEHSIVAIKDCIRADGAHAQTWYQVLQRFERGGGQYSLLHVVPLTGRKHQIRIHLAYVNHPLVGDKLYGGNEGLYLSFVRGTLTSEEKEALLLPFQALHAHILEWQQGGKSFRFKAEPPIWFNQFIPAVSKTSDGEIIPTLDI